MTLTHTFTKTLESVHFADPFKICNDCGGWVDGVLLNPDGSDLTIPCEHEKGYDSVCPSWGPVDGCTCAASLGHVPHELRVTA